MTSINLNCLKKKKKKKKRRRRIRRRKKKERKKESKITIKKKKRERYSNKLSFPRIGKNKNKKNQGIPNQESDN
jgi:hypothetical protein